MEGRKRCSKFGEALGQLTFSRVLPDFVDVVVPSPEVRKGNFQTCVGLDDVRNLLQALAEFAARVACGGIFTKRAQEFDCVEGGAGGSSQNAV